jgi:GAF domain-containing protein
MNYITPPNPVVSNELSQIVFSKLSSVDAGRFGEVLRTVLDHFSFGNGTLHSFHEDDQQLHLLAASEGMPEFILEKIRCIPLGKGIAGTAALTRKPVSICNLQTDSSPFIPAKAKELGAQGSVCIPLLAQGRVVGTLGVAWPESRELSAWEQTGLEGIGQVIANALA